MKKIIAFLKYAAVFAFGFITSFSGALDNIASIPNSYKELKKVYFYSGNSISGKWSNNTEYLLGGGELGLADEQPKIIMQVSVNEHDEISGRYLVRACAKRFQ